MTKLQKNNQNVSFLRKKSLILHLNPIRLALFDEVTHHFADSKEQLIMKQKKLMMIALMLVTLLLTGCVQKHRVQHHPSPTDTLYTESKAMDIYGQDPLRALQIIDSAEVVGNLSAFRASLLRAAVYSYPGEAINPDTARQICVSLLEHDSVRLNTENHMAVLRLLTDVARISLDYEDQVRWSTQLATLCRKCSKGEHSAEAIEALRAESEIGIALTHLGQREEGFAMIDHAIEALDNGHHFNELDACIVAMKRKLTALSLLPAVSLPGDSITAEKRYADIIQLAERFIAKLDDYEQHPADYADGSEREPDIDDVPGYCGFYRSQAYVFLANAYANSGKKSKAKELVSLFEQTDFGKTLNGRNAIAGTQCLLGNYDKMLATYDEMDRLVGADTLSSNYVNELRNRAVAAAARGDQMASQQYWQRYATLCEVVNDQLQASQAHNYAARYQAQELQMALQKESTAKSRSTLISAIFGLAFCFTLAFLFYFFRQRRVLKRKNRILVRQITEAMKYKDMYRNQSLSLQKDGENASPLISGQDSPVPAPTSNASTADGQTPAKKSICTPKTHPITQKTNEAPSGATGVFRAATGVADAPQRGANPSFATEGVGGASSLFNHLSQVIIDEQLFLNPEFDRHAAMERFHLSKERIGTAFAQGSDYASLAAFITACRVEYAARLLRQQPSLPITQVATASGFSSTNHFGRAFKSIYGLSPTEYRAAKVAQ